jgi:hypothetical protein
VAPISAAFFILKRFFLFFVLEQARVNATVHLHPCPWRESREHRARGKEPKHLDVPAVPAAAVARRGKIRAEEATRKRTARNRLSERNGRRKKARHCAQRTHGLSPAVLELRE